MHNPPYRDWKCCLTGGNTSAFDIALHMFAERRDYILAEEYTYLTAVETGHPLGLKFQGIKMDEEGLIPEHIDQILTDWDESAKEARKPYLLYTVSTGQNPTGATPSLERKREIYRVAQKHDLYILEDDPYHYLQMLPDTETALDLKNTTITIEEVKKNLIPSYLHIDTDGRVFRMDSFSKIICPGSRMGWVTASEQMVQRLVRTHETSLHNPSGFSQIMLFKLLSENFGQVGLLNWTFYLQQEYTQRRNNLVAAFDRYVPKGIVSLEPPKAGLFVSAMLESVTCFTTLLT